LFQGGPVFLEATVRTVCLPPAPHHYAVKLLKNKLRTLWSFISSVCRREMHV